MLRPSRSTPPRRPSPGWLTRCAVPSRAGAWPTCAPSAVWSAAPGWWASGEATRSSHEFFTVKHRVFRDLVEEKGFRAFALEVPWSTGLRLDAYLMRGEGRLKQIMDEEFQGTYQWWNNAEYRDLLQWMRAYDIEHPEDPVRFVGDDGGAPVPGCTTR